MGGRLDSTNAVTPIVSILTPIAMDHAQWLGDTLEKIAGEKAGILKPGVPAVSAPQSPEAAAVLTATAPVEFVAGSLGPEVRLNLRGAHQRRNAALAIAGLAAAGIPVPDVAIRDGLANVHWPGRFQVEGQFIFDGGHNAHGTAQLVETWRETFGDEKPVVIFGALRDKDYTEMLGLLAGIAAEFWFVPVDSLRSETPENLAAAVLSSRRFTSLPAALNLARSRSSSRFLLTGSLFLVGEALREMGWPDAFPPAAAA
jgi:dihydrofolate synthase/folylpolyglutamate synthase